MREPVEPPEPYALTPHFWVLTFLIGVGIAVGWWIGAQIVRILRA